MNEQQTKVKAVPAAFCVYRQRGGYMTKAWYRLQRSNRSSLWSRDVGNEACFEQPKLSTPHTPWLQSTRGNIVALTLPLKQDKDGSRSKRKLIWQQFRGSLGRCSSGDDPLQLYFHVTFYLHLSLSISAFILLSSASIFLSSASAFISRSSAAASSVAVRLQSFSLQHVLPVDRQNLKKMLTQRIPLGW